jgi:peptidoglycan/LPS O-acetylase OafA/YrhL
MKSERFLTLDGMRGLAAFVVVVHHVSLYFPSLPHLGSGYLAVDLFFGLSGFVLANAYADRFDNGMGVGEFMKARFIRLYPLYLLGTILCMPSFRQVQSLNLAEVVASKGLSLLMIPDPFNVTLYPLNIPGWSLFFELVANVVLVLAWRKLSVRSLCLFIGLGLLGLVYSVYVYGELGQGAAWDGVEVGLARVCFSFFVGVAICKWAPLNKLPTFPAWLVLGLMLAVFAIEPSPGWRGISDLLIVSIALPLLVAAGASSEPKNDTIRQLCQFGGLTSYAVYILHIPLLRGVKRGMETFNLYPNVAFMLAFGVLAVFVAWIVDRYYDAPVRRRLTYIVKFA